MLTLQKLVSGGQTGVDRAALDWALHHGIPIGGWCPAGRLAEDGPIDPRYPLRETPSEGYSQRTEWNVRDSDGTVLLVPGSELVGGTKLTKEFAVKWSRPCLPVCGEDPRMAGPKLAAFLDENRIETLNVAGPRLSTDSRAKDFAWAVLEEALRNAA